MGFIAGAFNATLGGNAVGQARTGFTIEWFNNGEVITGDNFGSTPQDVVNTGIEVFVEVDLLEFDAVSAQSLMWPFNTTFGAGPVIGTLQSGVISYSNFVLTARTGSTADTLENTWTFERVKLAEGFPTRVILQPGLRTVPLRLRVFPNSSNVFFVVA